MIDNSTNNKLDEVIKNTLSNYDESYDANDWARMESMLDAAPKSKTFNWKYALSILIGIGAIGGGYLMYTTINSPKTNDIPAIQPIEDIVTKTPSFKEKSGVPLIPVDSSLINKEELIKKEDTPVIAKETIKKSKDEVKENAKEVKKDIARKKDIEKKKKKKTDTNKIQDEDYDFTKNQKVSIMGNEPVFPDMLDSSKGIIGTTREKETTKKAAKAKNDAPIDWMKFINPDSLKKYRDKRKNDSIKEE